MATCTTISVFRSDRSDVICLDTSAIVAVLFREPEEAIFLRVITSQDVVIRTPALVEARMPLQGYRSNRAGAVLRRFLRDGEITIVPFDAVMFEAASDAFARFGKGRGHPAKLNFSDCMAYGTAKVHAVPLLFKGDDFVHTDIEPAYRPVP